MFLALASAQGAHPTSGGFLLVGIAMILVGGSHVIKPNWSYRMSRWQYKNKAALEPSHAALVAARCAGLVGVAVGAVMVVVAISR